MSRPQALGAILPRTLKTTGQICYVPREQWKQNKKRIYEWVDSCAKEKQLSPTYRTLLKGLANCCDIHGVSHVSIPGIIEATSKIAPYKTFSSGTVKRFIAHCLKHGLISRTPGTKWKETSTTRLLAPFLVDQQGIILIPVLPIATSHSSNNNNTKTDLLKEKTDNKHCSVFSKEQLAILATILSWKTDKPTALRWLKTYTIDEIQKGIAYMQHKNISYSKRGGYMRIILQSLDERKAEAAKLLKPGYVSPMEQETKEALRQHEANAYRAKRLKENPERRGAALSLLKQAKGVCISAAKQGKP
ncbi:MAG: hypothetical protein KIH63_004630 [Candidatus Saccharibacteria bacterium]|nr:hypothetical protein [Candidatus Saccharibacteria bacterium]